MTDLVERLREGCVTHPKRWTGDTHDDLGGSVDMDATDALMTEAATALEAQKIQQWYRDALDEIDELLAAAKKSESRIAQLTAALEAAREDSWQPIETAPKDGSLYLCWVSAIRYGERDDGSPDSIDLSEVDFCQWEASSAAPDGGFHMNMMGQIGHAQDITHWMPLPAPPAIDAARKEVGNE